MLTRSDRLFILGIVVLIGLIVIAALLVQGKIQRGNMDAQQEALLNYYDNLLGPPPNIMSPPSCSPSGSSVPVYPPMR